MPEVAEANSPATVPVGIGGADAPKGRAEPRGRVLSGSKTVLPRVLHLVDRKDRVGPVGDHDLAAQELAGLQVPDLVLELERLDHHARTADSGHSVPEDAARHLVEDDLSFRKNDRVTGVGASPRPDHIPCPGGEEVGDLPLRLVAELRAQDDSDGRGFASGSGSTVG